jgi:hypothetical protein
VAEFYVRPPLVAQEAAGQVAARWRYRIVVFVLLVAVFTVTAWFMFRLLDPNAAEPGVDALSRVLLQR